ncbi:MAG: hypothetical protein ABI548_26255 [Polyangiaceae bacterium]
MSYSNPKRLRAKDGLSKPLREALRELPNADPTVAQLESLRVRLEVRSVRDEEFPRRALPFASQSRHTPARKLRRTIAALVLFPVAAAAAVGSVVELAQRAPVHVAPRAKAAAAPANQRQRTPSGAAASAALPVPLAANEVTPSAVEPAPAAPPIAVRTGNSATSPEVPNRSAPLAAVGAPAAATFDTAPASSTPLAAEIALLQRANSALKADPATALALATQHRQTFPNGNLAQEREVIAIKALQAMGETEQARAGLASFERAYPHSAHVLELRQIVR